MPIINEVRVGLFTIVLAAYEVIMPMVFAWMLVHSMISELIRAKMAASIFRVVVIDKLKLNAAYKAKEDFSKSAIGRYDALDFMSKNTHCSSEFWRLMNSAADVVFEIMAWGLPTILNVIGNVLVIIGMFAYHDRIRDLILLIGTFSAALGVLYAVQQAKFIIEDRKARTYVNRLRSKIELALIPFQYREYSAKYVSALAESVHRENLRLELHWSAILSNMTIVNSVVVLVVCSSFDNVLVFMMLMMDFSNSVYQFMKFLMQFKRLNNDYVNYEQFWAGCTQSISVASLPIPTDLSIVGCNASLGKFALTMPPMRLPFHIGSKTLIRGRTGSGKSTFLHALMGKIPGMAMNHGIPANYHYAFADMFQNIREKMPSNMVSIRDYFKGEVCDEVIRQFLRDTFELEELDALGPLDKPLNEKLSGGMKSRLCLATRLYELVKFGKKILILDEPEQGSDPDTAVNVLNGIFQKYAVYSIVLITHLHEQSIGQLNVVWTNRLLIDRGCVKKIIE